MTPFKTTLQILSPVISTGVTQQPGKSNFSLHTLLNFVLLVIYRDGYTFTNEPIALFRPSNTTYVYSGSAVVDSNNTSGFFPNQTNGVVAIFTLAGALQTQDIAYSRDGGYTFEYYENNPVLDINSTQFRDPKVTIIFFDVLNSI